MGSQVIFRSTSTSEALYYSCMLTSGGAGGAWVTSDPPTRPHQKAVPQAKLKVPEKGWGLRPMSGTEMCRCVSPPPPFGEGMGVLRTAVSNDCGRAIGSIPGHTTAAGPNPRPPRGLWGRAVFGALGCTRRRSSSRALPQGSMPGPGLTRVLIGSRAFCQFAFAHVSAAVALKRLMDCAMYLSYASVFAGLGLVLMPFWVRLFNQWPLRLISHMALAILLHGVAAGACITVGYQCFDQDTIQNEADIEAAPILCHEGLKVLWDAMTYLRFYFSLQVRLNRPSPSIDRRRANTGRQPGCIEGKAPQRPQKRLDRRLEEVAKAVGGGYGRLQMPLKQHLPSGRCSWV